MRLFILEDRMGGKVAEENCIIGAVIPKKVKEFIVSQVKDGKFETISKAVRHYLLLAIRNSNPEILKHAKLDRERRKRFRFLCGGDQQG